MTTLLTMKKTCPSPNQNVSCCNLCPCPLHALHTSWDSLSPPTRQFSPHQNAACCCLSSVAEVFHHGKEGLAHLFTQITYSRLIQANPFYSSCCAFTYSLISILMIMKPVVKYSFLSLTSFFIGWMFSWDLFKHIPQLTVILYIHFHQHYPGTLQKWPRYSCSLQEFSASKLTWYNGFVGNC